MYVLLLTRRCVQAPFDVCVIRCSPQPVVVCLARNMLQPTSGWVSSSLCWSLFFFPVAYCFNVIGDMKYSE